MSRKTMIMKLVDNRLLSYIYPITHEVFMTIKKQYDMMTNSELQAEIADVMKFELIG